MRDLMLFAAFVILVPYCLRNTAAAYIVWAWSGAIAVDSYLYGFMRQFQPNMTFALTTLVLIALGRDPGKRPFEPNRTSILLILFGIQALISATFAYANLWRNWELFNNLVKGLLFCLLMPMVITSRVRIHALVIVLATGLCFHGILDGLKLIASGGGHLSRGLGKFGDNNQFGTVMTLSPALLLYLAQHTSRRWVKFAFAGAAILTVLCVVSTRSRGGLLAIVAMGIALSLNSRRKGLALTMVACGAAAVIALAGAGWAERMGTIQEASEDGSFMGRVMAWKRSSAIALENPLTGGGFHAVQEAAVYWKFAYSDGLLGFIKTPPPNGIAFAAHSIYFEVMGDLGFIGFFLFVLIFANAFYTRREIRRMIPPGASHLTWARDLADMISVSLVAYMVGGALVSVAYFEVLYAVIMLLEVLKQEVRRSLARAAVPQAAQAPPANPRMVPSFRGGSA